MIHLDTNFLISAAVPSSLEARRLATWLRRAEPIATSAIAWAEFLCGPVTTIDIEAAATLAGEPIPFGADDSVIAARLFNTGGRRRGSLRDCMIAATALNDGAALATNNPADFQRFVAMGLVLAKR